jgi:type IV pilus assembly protein PilY1
MRYAREAGTRRCGARGWMRTAGCVLLAVFVAAGGAQAETCEIPLFVKQGLNGANVMILADISGSMNAAIYDLAYDSDVEYPGVFNRDATYFVAKDGMKEPKDFYWAWPSSPSAYLVNSDNGEDGRYDGNYLNWIYFHATDEQRAAVPQVTRIQVLKEILSEIIYRSQRLNFGLTVFQYNHGGSIIGKCGVNPTSLQAQIAGLTANTWTPLGESMEDVLDYFAYDGPDAAIQVPCQYNFCLVVTDGLPTMDLDVSPYLWDADGDGDDPGNCTSIGAPYPDYNDCSDHFDDVTYYMAHNDLRPDLDGDQTISTYVVGFRENNRMLEDAAVNGDGLFFYAENAVELYLSIEYAIQDILRRISAGSAVAVVSTERGTNNRLYRGKFMPIDWDGFMECYALPYQEGDAAMWEAGELLRARDKGSRRIFTALGSSTYDFAASNATTLKGAMQVFTDETAADLISWGRGENVLGYRNRNGWVLGPIVHSTPVVVGAPANYLATPEYQAFYQAHENRRKMIYVGANDGMLHGFDAESGEEVWAFVPELALPAFEVMADSFYCHKYSVDQTVTVKDVQLDGVWKTVLISGGRQGGSSVFALDVTYPNSPQVLWQVDLPDGNTFTSDVEVCTVGGEAMAFVGSGLDTLSMEAWLHGYRIEDGSLLGSVLLSQSNKVLRNKATRPASVDMNLDGQADIVYIADLMGEVYRFVTDGNPDPDAWKRSTLFTGDSEITANPVVAYGPNGAAYVYVGTGAYLQDDDMTTLDPQRFMCVFDNHSGSTATLKGMKDQSSSVADVSGASGWYVDLEAEAGERVTQQAVIVAETVIFTSFAPTQDACVAGGNSYLYQMRYEDGGNTESQEDLDDRMEALGQGIASYPVVDLSAGTVVVQSSDASISVSPIANIYQRLTVRSWQENFDHVQPAPEPAQVP